MARIDQPEANMRRQGRKAVNGHAAQFSKRDIQQFANALQSGGNEPLASDVTERCALLSLMFFYLSKACKSCSRHVLVCASYSAKNSQ